MSKNWKPPDMRQYFLPHHYNQLQYFKYSSFSWHPRKFFLRQSTMVIFGIGGDMAFSSSGRRAFEKGELRRGWSKALTTGMSSGRLVWGQTCLESHLLQVSMPKAGWQ